ATAEALVALGRELSASLDRRQALVRIPEMAATAAGCDFAVLSTWDRESATVRILGAHGFSAETTQQLLRLPINTARAAFSAALARDGYIEVTHPQQLSELPAGLMEQWQISSLLARVFGPVDRQLGGLTVGYRQRTGPFSDAQKRLIDGIC